jgi:hypothetical protein
LDELELNPRLGHGAEWSGLNGHIHVAAFLTADTPGNSSRKQLIKGNYPSFVLLFEGGPACQ